MAFFRVSKISSCLGFLNVMRGQNTVMVGRALRKAAARAERAALIPAHALTNFEFLILHF
jgi:hypothetical protein